MPRLQAIKNATRLYEGLLELLFVSLPMAGIYYLLKYQDPSLCVVEHHPHVLVTTLASLLSLFMAYVSYLCYCQTRSIFLRYLTLAFFAFALCYEPHSLLTLLAEQDTRLFLIYGPVSRVTMNGLLLLGLWHYQHSKQPDVILPGKSYWLRWMTALLLLDALVFWLVNGNLLPFATLRSALEWASILMAIAGILFIFRYSRQRTLILRISMLALLYLLQGSLAFLWATPWNHLWWYAHLVTAAGFFLFSYITLRAYHAAGDLSHVYSLDEMVLALRQSESRLHLANLELQTANQKLAAAHDEMEKMAMQDALIGINNRRGFFRAAERELARTRRQEANCAVLMLDIDHFKRINDTHGHDIGDLVLKTYSGAVQGSLRPSDIFARMGGEEFVVLLPDTGLLQAEEIAERIRQAVADLRMNFQGETIRVTVSIGVSAWREMDSNSLQAMLSCADARLYRAKAEGRNQVMGTCSGVACSLPTAEN